MFLFATPLAAHFTTTKPDAKLKVVSGTHAELVGTDDMYLPTTQIRIKPNGEWHRRGPEDEMTACGEAYSTCAIREYTAHVPGLCEQCFTPHERAIPLLTIVEDD